MRIALFICKLQGIIIGIGKLRESKQPGGPGLAGIIDAGDAEPVVAVLFNQDQMMIIVIPLINIYAYGVKGEELHFTLIIVYGVMILIYAAGFLAFRRVRKQNSDKGDEEK